MADIDFNSIGTLGGLTNPTSLTFGADGRLYVTQQNGEVIALTVTIQNGEFVEVAGSQREVLSLDNGLGVVRGIINHDDDGSIFDGEQTNAGGGNAFTDRQVTGIVASEDASGNPVFYISSSDPRISVGGSGGGTGVNGNGREDTNLDTNSGIITKVTGTPDGSGGFTWDAIDIVRGLPRSEENHSVNGMALDAAENKLYVQVGGNTNNGAPGSFFSFTAEYALSGTLLEIDLDAIEALPVLTDDDAGKPLSGIPGGGNDSDIVDGSNPATSRKYVYDLPTLDDPNIVNNNDGVGEDLGGLDEDGPFGGNDGFNQAILVDGAPVRIFVDGTRNAYDVVRTLDGKFYTVDNGSNGNLGAEPIVVEGSGTNTPPENETPPSFGAGDPEPLFLLLEGEYYGHGNPNRGNPTGSLAILDDQGNPYTPTGTFNINSGDYIVTQVADISTLVPASLVGTGSGQINPGNLIDPSQFANLAGLSEQEFADRLAESSVTVERAAGSTPNPNSPSIVNLGSSTNGIVEYTSDAFDGALQGALIVTQFNDNFTVIKLNEDGTALAPIVNPGDDGILGTGDDFVQESDGLLSFGATGNNPLDVIVGDSTNTYSPAEFDGLVIGALIGADNLVAFAPTDESILPDLDLDDDGILDVNDPFTRDASNGATVVLTPGTTLVYDFDDNLDGNQPGPDGIVTGLTGVATNGADDFEASLSGPSEFQFSGNPRPNQLAPLDNIKENTAAGGGANVIELVSNGTASGASNTGEFLFQAGVTVPSGIETFTVNFDVFNPNNIFDPNNTSGDNNSNATEGSFTPNGGQEIGGFIGTGDQSNFLKVVLTNGTAASGPNGPGFIIELENNDTASQSVFIEAADVFDALESGINQDNGAFNISLTVDRADDSAVASITYPSNATGGSTTVSNAGTPINLSGSNVLDAINGNFTVNDAGGQPQTTGLAVGLFSTNGGEFGPVPEDQAFTAQFDGISISATGDIQGPSAVVLNPFENASGTADGTVVAQDENLVIVVQLTDTTQPIDLNSISADDLVVTVNGVTVPAGDMELLSLLDDPLLGSESDDGSLAPLTFGDDTYVTFIARPPSGGWDLGGAAVGVATSVEVTATLAEGSILNTAGGANDAASGTFTTNFVDTGTNVVQAFNHGGGTQTVEGVVYLDDEAPAGQFPTGLNISASGGGGDGNTFGNAETTADITGEVSATDATLYGTERSAGTGQGQITFTISQDAAGVPLKANADYAIQLGFAEIFADASQGSPNVIDTFGERVFDVIVNGETVLDDFDIFARAPGGHTILEKTVLATSNASGELVIQLNGAAGLGGAQQPKINASKITELPGDGDPVVAVTVADTSVNESEGTVDVVFSLSQVVPGGVVTVPFTVTDVETTTGVDYTPPSPLEVTFDGTDTATATFAIADEGGAPELQETFTVTVDEGGITGPAGFVFSASGSGASATVTIVDSGIPGPAVNIVDPFAADLGDDGSGNPVAGEVYVATDDNITIVVELTDAEGVDLSTIDATDLVVTVNGQVVPGADMELLTLFDDPLLSSQGNLETDDGQLAPVVDGDVTSIVFIAKAPTGGWDIGGAAVGVPTLITVDATLQADSVLNTLGGGVLETTASFTTGFIDPGTDVVRAINAGGGSNGVSPGTSIVVDGVTYEDDDTVQGESNGANAGNNTATPPAGVVVSSQLADGTPAGGGGDGNVFGGTAQLDDIAGEGSPEEAQLFATERWAGNTEAKLTYTISEDASGNALDTNGTYAVELSFAEIFNDASNAGAGNNAPGLRVFDVLVNDEIVINDLDLFARAPGAHVIIERTVLANVVDGAIEVSVDGAGLPDNAKISAFKITKISSGTDTEAPVATLDIVFPADADGAIDVNLSFDEDVTGLTADNIVLTVPNPNGGVVLLQDGVLTPVDAQNYTVTFAAPTQGFANGDYTATLAASSVADSAGNEVAETFTSETLTLALDPQEIYDENVDGDLSDAPETPSVLPELVDGSNLVTLWAQDANDDETLPFGSDRDYFTVVVPDGFVLSALVLDNYDADSATANPNDAFLAVAAEGQTISADPFASEGDPGTTNLIGGIVFGETEEGQDILSAMSTSDAGSPAFTGFDLPLPAGTYNFWLNQNGLVSRATLDFQISAVVDQPPVFDPATPTVLTAPENSTDPIFDFTATDPNDDPVTFSISTEDVPANIDADSFTIDPTTGVLSFVGGQDFEIPTDNDESGDYQVIVVATANGQSTEQAITVNLTDVEPEVGPNDIDGDGTLNGDDPFAFDGQNGLGRTLLPGGQFIQTFDTPTNDPFSAEGGFSGILVNPDFDYPNSTPTDPYGDRTFEDKVSISGGTLSIGSSNFDAFETNSIAANNTLADGYQSGVDVTGVDSFEVVARVSSAEIVDALQDGGFQQFGISIGAGGVDDFVKLIFGDQGNPDPTSGRVEFVGQGSLGGSNPSVTLTTIDATLVGDYEFTLTVNKSVDGAGVLTGTVDGAVEFFAASDGASLGTINMPQRPIDSAGSLAAALKNENPLTNGVGGLAYGVFVTDWNNNNIPITANYDFLRITALDPVTGDTLVSIAPTGSAPETDTPTGSEVVALAVSTNPDAANQTIDVGYTINGVPQTPASIALDADGNGVLEVPFTSDDVADGNEAFTVVLTDVTTAGFSVNPSADTGVATVLEDDFAPVAVDDSESVLPGGSTTVAVLANDTDADDAVLSVTDVVDPGITGVTVTPNGDNTISVDVGPAVPAGDILINYTVEDAGGNQDVGTLTVTVIDVAATAPTVAIQDPFAGSDALVASDDDLVFVVELTDAQGIDLTSIDASDLSVTVNGQPVPVEDMAFLNLLDEPLGSGDGDDGQIAPAILGDTTLITFVASAPTGGWDLGGAPVGQPVSLDVVATLTTGSILDTIGVGSVPASETFTTDFIDVGTNVARALNAGGTQGVTPGATLVVNGVTYEDDDVQGSNAVQNAGQIDGVLIESPAGGGDGNPFGNAASVADILTDDPAEAQLYGTDRFRAGSTGDLKYTITEDASGNALNPNAIYAVELGFAEIFTDASQNTSANSEPGQRVFDVAINGNVVIPNLDLFPLAPGGHTIIERTFLSPIDENGALVLEFIGKGFDNPKINAIKINELPATLVAIAPNATAEESSDVVTDATATSFTVSTSPASANQELSFTLGIIDTPAQTEYTVTLDENGEATVDFDISGFNDDVADGDDNVTVTLQSVGTVGFAVDATNDESAATITEDDFAPVATPDAAFVELGQNVVVDVTDNVTDQDDDVATLTYSLVAESITGTAGATAGDITDNSDGTFSVAAPAGAALGQTVIFDYQVADPGGNTTVETVTVTIADNVPVTADVTVEVPTETLGNIIVQIDFGEPVSTPPSTIFDPASVTLTNTNGLSRNDGVVTFSNGDSSASIEFTAPPGGFEQDVDYSASIAEGVVTDPSGNSNLADISDPATFAIDDAPGFVSGPNQLNLLENRDGVIAAYSATDPDGDDVSYALSQPGLDAGFTIDPVTGQLSAPEGGFDFEAGTIQFSFDVIASSTGTDAIAKTAVQAVTIDLLDVNEDGPTEFEVEDFDDVFPIGQSSAGEFFEENQSAASGGKVGRLSTNGQGTATLTLDENSGVAFGQNTITVDYFDESDGVSSFTLNINGGLVGTVTLDNDGGGNAAQSANLRTATFTNVIVPENAVITLVGQANATEFVRLDKIGFLFTDGSTGGGNQPPIAVNTIDLSGLSQGDTINIPLEGENPIFVDPDEQSLTFTLSPNAPDFLDIVGGAIVNTREITNDDVIASAQSGPITVTVTANDGEFNALTTFDLSVENVNDAPTVVPENVNDFNFETSDVDIVPIDAANLFDDIDLDIPGTTDALSFEATGLPPELSIDPVTGQITGAVTTPGSFQVSVTATDTGGEFATANFTITVGGEPVLGDPIRIQVEDFDNVAGPGGYFIENQGNADQNQVARLGTNGTGEATLALNGVQDFSPGAHNILIAFFDENDGASTLTVKIRTPEGPDQVVGEIVFDADAGGNAAQQSSFRQVTLQGITLPENGTLVLEGQADGYNSAEAAESPNRTTGNEFVRLDYVELIPTISQPGNFAPFPIPGFNVALEASEGTATFPIGGAFGDPEEDALTYGLAPVDANTPVPSFLSIDPTTGVLSMTGSAVDQDTSFDFLVTATDVGGSGQTVSRPFSLNVLDSPLPMASATIIGDLTEGSTTAEVELALSGGEALTEPATVRLQVVAGATDPATPGDDVAFDALGATTIDVTIPVGGTVTTSLVLADDGPVELPESFAIEIIAANIGTTIDENADQLPFVQFSSEGQITDADFAPVATADSESVFEGNSITFNPADNDTDADLDGGVLTVVDIDTSTTVGGTVLLNLDGTVTVTADSDELTGDIIFGYTVEDQFGNQDTTGTATVVVTPLPELTISGPEGPVPEGADATFTVALNGNAPSDVTVNFTLAPSLTNGATADVDFDATGGSVVIPQGFPSATIDIPTFQDLLLEAAEGFVVTVTDASFELNGSTVNVTLTTPDAEAFIAEEGTLGGADTGADETVAIPDTLVEVFDFGGDADPSLDTASASAAILQDTVFQGLSDGDAIEVTDTALSLTEIRDAAGGGIELVFDDLGAGTDPIILNLDGPGFESVGDLTEANFNVDVDGVATTISFVEEPILATDGRALFTANLDATGILGTSTFSTNSMQITNQSANGVAISKVTIDLGSTFIPDTVFDVSSPPAGDAANKPFQQDSASVGFTVPSDVQNPVDYAVSFDDAFDNGFNQLILDFNEGAFAVGDLLSFSLDIDPISATVGNIGGAVSGSELAGGTVTVEFEDGTTATSSIVPQAGFLGGTSLVQVGQSEATPLLQLGDGTTAPRVVNQSDLPIRIEGGLENANGQAQIFILDTAFVNAANTDANPSNDSPNPPGGVDAIQGNNIQAAPVVVTVDLDENGVFFGTIPVTRSLLQEANANGNLGFNYFAAGIVNGEGAVSNISAPLVVEFDPAADVDPIIPIDDVTAPVAVISAIQAPADDQDITITVTATDASGIDLASLGNDDLLVTSNDAADDAALATPASVTPVENGDGSVTATYVYTAPVDGWSGTDFTAQVVAGTIFDNASPAANANEASSVLPFTFDAEPQTVLLRLNTSGPANSVEVAAIDGGPNWLADDGTFFTGSQDRGDFDTTPLTPGLPGVPDAIFETARSNDGGFSYNFDVVNDLGAANGTFTVNLYFAEAFDPNNVPDEREFDIFFENVLSFDNFDVAETFNQDGGVISQVVEVTDGILNIDFQGVVDNPIISAIEILGGGELPPDETGPVATIVGASVQSPNDPVTILVNLFDVTGVDLTSLGADDLTVTSGSAADDSSLVTPASVTPELNVDGSVTVTYVYDAPQDGWTGTDFTAVVNAGAISDLVPGTPNTNAASAPFDFAVPGGGDAETILANATGVDDDGSYGQGAVGSAVLTILDGGNGVESSNFGSNSFQLTNTGDKQIAAVVIDFRTAVFNDSVVDFDGTGGDVSAKPFGVVNNGGSPETGGTGIVVDPTNTAGGQINFFDDDTYLFPGATPLPNTSGGGNTNVSGGFRGLLLKFDGSEGGFTNGETVGFAGDMDPNSIAGLAKGGTLGVDTDSIGDPGSVWDVGGISGAELNGSTFTVLFDDGTTATGYLGSDGSQAGSVGEAVEDRAPAVATLSVATNGETVQSGDTGEYSAAPVVTVTGPVGETVRVTLQKGFNPVANTNGGLDTLVANRLAVSQPDFQVNNVFDTQTVDVVIPAGGSITLPVEAFDYENISASGVAFDDSNRQPLAFTAAVIGDVTDNTPDVISGEDVVPIGPVSAPIYLTFDDTGPAVITSPATASVEEDGEVFVIDVNASGDVSGYSIVPAGDGALFTIDPDTGVLSFNTAPDFENPLDGNGDNIYDVTVQASGPEGNDTQTIAVEVTDAFEPVEGFFEGIGSGSSFRFKIQIEDVNGGPNGGTDPNGQWTFIAEGDPDDVINENSQGAGYYRFGSETSIAIEPSDESNGENQLFYRIFIPDDEVGNYSFRFRAGRQDLDGIPGDQQNDIWLNLVKEDEPGSEIEDFLITGSNEAEPTSGGYVKVFGGPQNNTFGGVTGVDGAPGNFQANVSITEGGFYTIEVAGRSQGFFVDAVELYKQGNAPGELASSSPFIVTGPTSPTVQNDLTAETVVLGNSLDVSDVFVDEDGNEGQPLDVQAVLLVNGQPVALPSNGISFVNNEILVAGNADLGSYTVQLTATDLDLNTAVETFVLTVAEQPDPADDIGFWEFNAGNPTLDETVQNNSAILQNGASASGSAVELDGANDYIEIPDIALYDILEGGLSITFTVDSLNGVDNGTTNPTPALNVQGIFSRDSSGFDGGGHVSAWVDGDGSVVIRHQTTSGSNLIESAAGTVQAGQQITLVYLVSDSDGMQLFTEDGNGNRTLVGQNAGANVSFAGNNEPWVLGALQTTSGDGVANNIFSNLEGSIAQFRLFEGDGEGGGTGGSNLPPVTVGDDATVAEDGSLTNIDVLSNDSDPEGDLPLQLVGITQPANGTATTNANGTINYTPDPDFFGQDTVVYTVVDIAGQQSNGTLTIEVTPVDDPSVANDDTASTTSNTSVQIAVLSNDTDPDGETPTITDFDATSSQGGTITNNGGVLTYTPAIDFEGADSFEYTVSGGDTATVDVTVTSEPQPAEGLGLWEFNSDAPTQDETVQDNSAILQNGASVSGGEVQLDGINDYVEIPDLGLYDIVNGGLAITFTVDTLSGIDNGTLNPVPFRDQEGLFSRDSSGFDGGGHVSAWVDGDGSVVVRHQTTNGSEFIDTAAGVVQTGQEISLVYTVSDSSGMALYSDDGNGNLTLIGQNADANVSFAGNDEPWVLGALQSNSGNGIANNVNIFMDGSIDEFRLFDGDGDFNF